MKHDSSQPIRWKTVLEWTVGDQHNNRAVWVADSPATRPTAIKRQNIATETGDH